MGNVIYQAAKGLMENPPKKVEWAKTLEKVSKSVAEFLKEKSEKEAEKKSEKERL